MRNVIGGEPSRGVVQRRLRITHGWRAHSTKDASNALVTVRPGIGPGPSYRQILRCSARLPSASTPTGAHRRPAPTASPHSTRVSEDVDSNSVHTVCINYVRYVSTYSGRASVRLDSGRMGLAYPCRTNIHSRSWCLRQPSPSTFLHVDTGQRGATVT